MHTDRTLTEKINMSTLEYWSSKTRVVCDVAQVADERFSPIVCVVHHIDDVHLHDFVQRFNETFETATEAHKFGHAWAIRRYPPLLDSVQ